MRSQTDITSAMLCSIRRTPASKSSRTARTTAAKSGTSSSGSPAAGSSRSTYRGLHASARATPSFRSSPCGSEAASASARWPSSSRSSRRSARRRASRRPARTPSAATSTFSRTVRPRNERLCWNVRARPARPRLLGLQRVMSLPANSTLPTVGKSKPLMTFTSVVLPAPLGPIRPTTSCLCNSRVTSRSASMPEKDRETPVARSVSPGHRFSGTASGTDTRQGPTLAGVPAEMLPTYLPLLFSTSITRYERPKTVWNFFEKLILPEIVDSPRKRSNWLARTLPFVDPFARLIAVASASITVAPVTKLPVGGVPACRLIVLKRRRTAGLGSSPKIDAKVTYQYFVTFGFFGYQFVPSPAHEFMIGVFTRRLRTPCVIAGQSPNVVEVTITWAPLVFRSRLTRLGTWFGPPKAEFVKLSLRTILPPRCVYRVVNALTTVWK